MPIKGIAHILAAADRELANKTNTWWPDAPGWVVFFLAQLGGRCWIIAGWVERSPHRARPRPPSGSGTGAVLLICSGQTISADSVVSCLRKNMLSWARSQEDCTLKIPWPLASSVSQVNYFPHLCFIFPPISVLFHPPLTPEKWWQQTLPYENVVRQILWLVHLAFRKGNRLQIQISSQGDCRDR